MSGELTQSLIFEVQTPKINGGGFKGLLQDLQAIDMALAGMQTRFAGLASPGAFRKTKGQLEKELKSFSQIISKSTPIEIGKFLGMDERAVTNFFGKASAGTTGYFRNASAAAARFSKLTSEIAKTVDVTARAFGSFLTGNAGGQVPGTIPVGKVTQVAATLDAGMVRLVVPASQIHAVLEGAVNLTVPGGAVAGAASGGAAGPGAAIPPSLKAAAAGAAAEITGDVVEEVIKQTRAGITSSITRALAPFETETVTTGPKGGGSTVTRRQPGKALVQSVNDKLALEMEGLQANIANAVTGNKPADLRSKSGLLKKTADSLNLIRKENAEALTEMGQERVANALASREARLRAEAKRATTQAAVEEAKAAQAQEKETKRLARQKEQDEKRQARDASRVRKESLSSQERFERTKIASAKQSARQREKAEREAEKDREALRASQTVTLKGAAGRSLLDTAQADGFTPSAYKEREYLRRGKAYRSEERTLTKEQGGSVFTRRVTQEFDEAGKLVNTRLDQTQRALKATREEASAAGRDFLRNTANVTIWAASVATLYGTLGLLQGGLKSTIDVGLQTARLDQVFRGVGGSAKQLRDDVMGLAAANGRSAKEALDAAISWSRLGLTRAQVNEAVRVSLEAANVAELDAGEATQRLQAIYMAYGLTVGELDGVLGQLNETSNTFNVTNREMLDGISKTAGVSKQAGLGLSELIGLLGATIGSTGQSGSQVGNAIKALTVRLNSPETQKFLRKEFKIEPTVGGGGEVKTMSNLLADLYVQYQKLTQMERNYLLVRVAGTHQASRVASLLDSYIQAQILAINAQLNLNSAEEENNKIRATMASRLAGLNAEWERFVSKQADNGMMPALIEITTALRNLLALLNTDVGSAAFTGLMTVLTLMSVRLAVSTVQLGKLRGETGFVTSTFARASSVLKSVNDAMMLTNQRFIRLFLTMRSGLSVTQLSSGAMMLLGRGMAFVSRMATLAGRMVLFTVASLVQLVPFLAAGYGAMALFNFGMEALGQSSERAEKKLAGFNAEAERAAKAASAAMQAARLLETSQRALGNMRNKDDQSRLLGQLWQGKIISDKDSNAAMAALEKGDLAGVNKILQAEIGRRLQTASAERQNRFNAVQSEISATKDEIARLGQAKFGDKDKRKELEDKLLQKEGQRTQLIFEDTQDVGSAMQEWLSADQQHQINLERQKLLLEGIAETYRSLPASTPMDRFNNEMAGKQVQIEAIDERQSGLLAQKAQIEAGIAEEERMRSYLQAQARTWRSRAGKEGNPEKAEEMRQRAFDLENGSSARGGQWQSELTRNRASLEKNEEERRRVEKELEAMRAREAQVRQQTRFETAVRSAQAEAGRFDYGRNDAEKLDNREQGLRGTIQKKVLEAQEFGAGDDPVQQQMKLVEVLQHVLDLREAMLEKERLRYQLEKDEYQLMKDKQRELQKALLTAGPDEMLRRLAAFETGKKGVTAGKFFGMSPEMRQALADQYPQLSPEAAEIRNAKNRLGGPRGADGVQKDMDGLDRVQAVVREMLKPFIEKGNAKGELLGTERADTELAKLAMTAAGLTAQFEKMGEAVKGLERLLMRRGPAEDDRGRAGGLNLPQARGHAPGI